MTDAEHVASEFIADGPIYWQEEADGSQKEVDASPGGIATDPSIEVVVLIDRGSASASELVAGALQDRGRAKIDRRDDVRQGHGPAVAGARRARRRQAHGLEVADAGQALDPRVGITPDIAVTVPADTPPGSDPGPGPGARGPRRVGGQRGAVPAGRLRAAVDDPSCADRRVRLRFPANERR